MIGNLDLFRKPVRFINLGSGSKGNVSVVLVGRRGVLVDCGLSLRQVRLRLDQLGVDPSCLEAILVTHEHSDHTAGLRVVAGRLDLPVYMTEACQSEVQLPSAIEVRRFEPGVAFSVGGLHIEPFLVPHDTVDPVGFVLTAEGCRLGIATDLGSINPLVVDKLRRCQLILLEFNHDLRMLLDGPYPWHLKQRVRGRHGHLSNDQAGQLLAAVLGDGLEHVVLAHLSEKNNRPSLAQSAADAALIAGGARAQVQLHLAHQDEPTEVLLT